MSRRSRRSPALLRALLGAGAAAALAAAALPSAPIRAQEQPPQTEVFGDRVDVEVVNLEVMVTDRRGTPILGLTRDDFVILEDGQPVELTNFYAVENGARASVEEPAPSRPANTPLLDLGLEPEEPVVEALPPEQRLSLAVVIDNTNIDPPNRKVVLDQLREHLDRLLRPGDRVMVVSLKPHVEVHQTFTEEMEPVEAALDVIGRTAGGRADLFAQRRLIRNMIATRDGTGGGGGGAFGSQYGPGEAAEQVVRLIDSYASQAESVLRQTFGAIETVTSSLSGLPGRRAVLLVSEHLATNPAQGLYEEWYQAFTQQVSGLRDPVSQARRYDVGEALSRVAERAAADRVTFYTLQASGIAAAVSGSDEGAGSLATPAGFGAGETQPLLHLAAVTGGHAMLNSANAAALIDQMSTDYLDYYSLGYQSPKSHDGRYHRIEVRVPGRQGVRVRHASGYRAKTPEQRMKERVLSALILDIADNPLGVRVQLMDEKRQDRQYLLPVVVRVPIGQLVLVPQASTHVGRVSVVIAVQDAAGRLSEPQWIEVPVSIPNDRLLEAMGQEVGHAMNLLVRGGDAKLAVGVRDELSAIESTLNLNISVGKV